MSAPLRLQDLLQLSDDELGRAKVKFNQYNGVIEPMHVYLENKDEINTRWLFWRNQKRYFNINDLAICLFQLDGDSWLLSTIKTVTHELDVIKGTNYEGRELERYLPLFGRVIVRYHKAHQTQVRLFRTIVNDLEVQQILPSVFDGKDFPGYDQVRLSYKELSIILRNRKRDWIAALENQKAVYLITDLETGLHYVGSAHGDNGMLLQRWTNYIENGHGGNKLLMDIVDQKGLDYVVSNYQFSILENYNARVDRRIILERESWWKLTLGSRAFGLNSN